MLTVVESLDEFLVGSGWRGRSCPEVTPAGVDSLHGPASQQPTPEASVSVVHDAAAVIWRSKGQALCSLTLVILAPRISGNVVVVDCDIGVPV